MMSDTYAIFTNESEADEVVASFKAAIESETSEGLLKSRPIPLLI